VHRVQHVTFTDGVLDDVASLVGSLTDEKASAALKRRIAELLVECKASPYVGELMGPGRHPELANCRSGTPGSPSEPVPSATWPCRRRFRIQFKDRVGASREQQRADVFGASSGGVAPPCSAVARPR
jgi:hypothetical protein